LDAAAAGDLVLLQPDTIEQTIPWLADRYGSRLRDLTFDEIAGPAAHGLGERAPRPGEPVAVKPGRLGLGVAAVRAIAAGETIIRTWGEQADRRSPHSMQVDVNTHIVPDGVTVLLNHSCDPNCGVIIRSGVKQIELRALRPIAAGEEITTRSSTRWPTSAGPAAAVPPRAGAAWPATGISRPT
jgi:hypothetical protein